MHPRYYSQRHSRVNDHGLKIAFFACAFLSSQEAICSLHSDRKQLESTRNPKQEQICIENHKNVKLQDTHNLAKGSQNRVQMMIQPPNGYVLSFPDPARPYNRDTNKKNHSADLDSWPPARVIRLDVSLT